MRTALYRIFGADGALLYIGASANSFRRFGEHERTKEWAQSVSRIELEWFETSKEAFKAEQAAIRDEKPLHNIANTPRSNGAARRDLWEQMAREGLSMKEAAERAGVTYCAARKAASRYSITFRRHEYGDAA